MSPEETLRSLVDRFNQHAERTPKLQQELEGLSRTIVVRLTDERSYAVELTKARLTNLRPLETAAKADLTITTDRATFEGLVRREIGPMKALFAQKLSIAGSLEDKLLLRRLL